MCSIGEDCTMKCSSEELLNEIKKTLKKHKREKESLLKRLEEVKEQHKEQLRPMAESLIEALEYEGG